MSLGTLYFLFSIFFFFFLEQYFLLNHLFYSLCLFLMLEFYEGLFNAGQVKNYTRPPFLYKLLFSYISVRYSNLHRVFMVWFTLSLTNLESNYVE